MTDARIRGEWLTDPRFDGMTDRQWRVFSWALMWCAEQGTDGKIVGRHLKMIHPEGEDAEAIDALCELEIMRRTPDGVELIGWSDRKGLGQSSAEQVEAYRAAARAKQKRYRDRVRGDARGAQSQRAPEPQATGDVTGSRYPVTSPGDVGHLPVVQEIGGGKPTRPGDVTRNALSRYCRQHPDGTNLPCADCRDARERFEQAREARASATLVTVRPGSRCAPGEHRLVADGTCTRCDIRPGEAA